MSMGNGARRARVSSRVAVGVWIVVCSLVVLAVALPSKAAGVWTAPTLLNDAGDWANGAKAIKDPRIVADKDGGFHAVYNVDGRIRYRHYTPGVGLDPTTTTVFTPTGFPTFNANIGETPNGNVQVAWENWAGDTPEVGFSQSTNNGTSWSAGTEISNSSGRAKHPLVTGLGTGASSRSMVSYWNSNNAIKDLRYMTGANGAGFTDTYLGHDADNEYIVTGMARNHIDGSVFRAWGEATGPVNNQTYNLKMSRFDPVSNTWGTKIDIVSGLSDAGGSFPSRMQISVGATGKVLVVWDNNGGQTLAREYTPGVGFGASTVLWARPFFGNVTVAPGTDDFYIFNHYSATSATMRSMINGVPGTPEYIGTELSNKYVPNVRGDIGLDGRVYVTWEHWANNGNSLPVAYFAVRDSVPVGVVPEPAGLMFAATIGAVSLLARRRRTM